MPASKCPVEAFIVEANVGILTSLLFLKKKTDAEMDADAQGHVKDYPIFMAVAEKSSVHRRGNVTVQAQLRRHGENAFLAY